MEEILLLMAEMLKAVMGCNKVDAIETLSKTNLRSSFKLKSFLALARNVQFSKNIARHHLKER